MPRQLKILSFDPGYTTGVAIRELSGRYTTCVVTTRDECLELIIKGLDLVIVERFQTGGTLSAPGLHTIELGSEIVGYAKALKIPWARQQPTQRYGGMPLARGAVGPCIENSDVAKHEVDALAHIIAYELEHDVECYAAAHWKPKGAAGPGKAVRKTGLGRTGRPKARKPTAREQVERMKDRYR
jgi:hypothetical protein